MPKAQADNVSLRARDRKGLLRLIRYGARQCFSQERLSALPPVEHSIPWAELLQKTFLTFPFGEVQGAALWLRAPALRHAGSKVDVLECPTCQGRLSIIAFSHSFSGSPRWAARKRPPATAATAAQPR